MLLHYCALLYHQPLNLILQRPYLTHQIARLVGSNAARDNRSANAACSAERHLRRDVDLANTHQPQKYPQHFHKGCLRTYIRRILILTQQRQMQQDGQRRRIRRQNDNLRDTAIQRLGRFVGALFQLSVVRGLLHEVEDFLR